MGNNGHNTFYIIDLAGNWKVESFLIAMIIYSVLLTILSVLWCLKYYSQADKKPGKMRLVAVYALSPWFISVIGNAIEHFSITAEPGMYRSFHIFFGDLTDVFITILAPFILPIITSVVLAIILKKREKNI